MQLIKVINPAYINKNTNIDNNIIINVLTC